MSTIDRQRIAAVKTLEEMGNTFGGDKWFGPDATTESPEADAMHALLVLRADRGGLHRRAEEQEFSAIVSAIDAYERKRWPESRIPGGKGWPFRDPISWTGASSARLFHSRGRSPGETKRPPHHGGERRE